MKDLDATQSRGLNHPVILNETGFRDALHKTDRSFILELHEGSSLLCRQILKALVALREDFEELTLLVLGVIIFSQSYRLKIYCNRWRWSRLACRVLVLEHVGLRPGNIMKEGCYIE